MVLIQVQEHWSRTFDVNNFNILRDTVVAVLSDSTCA